MARCSLFVLKVLLNIKQPIMIPHFMANTNEVSFTRCEVQVGYDIWCREWWWIL